MNHSDSENSPALDLRELSKKTGLIVRSPDSEALTDLFARLLQADPDSSLVVFLPHNAEEIKEGRPK